MKKQAVCFVSTIFALVVLSSAASAQVTVVDPETGETISLVGDWTIVEDDEVGVAVNEEGCLLVLASVPEEEAEAFTSDLDSFLSQIVEDAEVAEAGVEEDAFMAYGTGTVEGEDMEWLLVGGIEEGYFGLIFAGATEDAETCSAEMEAILESL